MFSRSELLASSIVALWAALFLAPEGLAVVLAPLLGASVLSLSRYPRAGTLAAAALVLATFAAGVPKDNPGTLALALTASYSLGRHGSGFRDLPLVLAIVIASLAVGGPTVADVVFLSIVFGAAWTIGRIVASRAARSVGANELADALADRDPGEIAAQVVAQERARIAVDAVEVIRSSVAEMGASARKAEESGDREALIEVQRRGRSAVAELRHLLGILRSETGPVNDRAAMPPDSDRSRSLWPLDLGIGAVYVLASLVDLQLSDLFGNPASIVLMLALSVPIVIARTRLMLALCVTAVLLVSTLILDEPLAYGFSTLLACGIFAWFSVIAGGPPTWGVAATAGLLLLIAARRTSPGNEPMLIAGIAIPAMAAHAWRKHFDVGDDADQRAALLSAEHREIADAARRSERLRVARELHDVASHAVGVMVLQAGAALSLWSNDPDAAAEAVGAVITAGDEAKTELSQLAELLEVDEPAPRSAALNSEVADQSEVLQALVQRMSSAGINVAMVSPDGPVDPVAFATVYRVVQEALTNAARHAQGSRVDLVVEDDGEWVNVRVIDDGAREGQIAGVTDSGGFGLIGLTERVESVGGSSSFRRTATGGFALTARIPLRVASGVTA